MYMYIGLGLINKTIFGNIVLFTHKQINHSNDCLHMQSITTQISRPAYEFYLDAVHLTRVSSKVQPDQ